MVVGINVALEKGVVKPQSNMFEQYISDNRAIKLTFYRESARAEEH